jgi:hypothetical protein
MQRGGDADAGGALVGPEAVGQLLDHGRARRRIGLRERATSRA